MKTEEVRYRETQHFHGLFYLFFAIPLVLFVFTFCSIELRLIALPPGTEPIPYAWLLLAILIPTYVTIFFMVNKMVIEVNDRSLVIQFGMTSLMRKEIPLSQVVSAEVVAYSPLWNFGGWGIRLGTFNGESTGCYTMRGKEGVLLTLSEKTKVFVLKVSRILIGSGRAAELAEAVSPPLGTCAAHNEKGEV
ncbi:MAG: hypothetical protein RDV48_12570 [Candidatus Eremiobacteraeota bacterium]|nr:hypothetical protein [Candidatus Eremiobacteraeota bacterium]